jgi:hypothetical protein
MVNAKKSKPVLENVGSGPLTPVVAAKIKIKDEVGRSGASPLTRPDAPQGAEVRFAAHSGEASGAHLDTKTTVARNAPTKAVKFSAVGKRTGAWLRVWWAIS